LVKTGISFIRQTFLIRQGKNFNNRIINHFYGSLLNLPKSFFDNRKTGELVARLNDTMRIQAAVSYITTNLMLDVLLVIITSCFILFYSKVLGLIALLSIPAYFVIVYVFHNRIVSSQREVMAAYAKNESNYVDTIQGVGVIKVANKESMFSEITRRIYNFFQEKVYTLGEVRIRFNFTTEIMGTTLIMGIITLSSLMVLNNTIKLGQMMAILQMVGMLMPAAGRLAMTNIQLQEARVAFDRMFEFTSISPEYNPETEKSTEKLGAFESLEVRNLSFRFPGRSELLKDISFHVRKGEIITLLGESGCGKSTTLQILQKFYGYENGTVAVNGIDWEDVSVKDWRNTIAIIAQDIKIFNGPLIDNVCLGDEPKDPQELIDFFRQYGFDKYFESFPQSYDTLLGEEGVNISGGQQQLVALARALYKKPQLLLMDEATSAMDRNTEGFVLDLLQKARDSMGVILVTHRVKTAKSTDRIYVIEDGVIKASGSHSELLKSDNLYANTWKDFQGS
jgi:ATP-binding cassette subfamily B protein